MAQFPPPPPYFKFYTDESKSKFEGVKDFELKDHALNIHDLEHWIPPDPSKKAFILFGEEQLTNYQDKTLPQNVEKLFSGEKDVEIAFSAELRKLNMNVGDEFLALLESLVEASSDSMNHVKNIKNYLLNIVVLLNRLRPFQARQTLISVLRDQIEERNKKTKELMESVSKIKTYISDHGVREEDLAKNFEEITLVETDDVLDVEMDGEISEKKNGDLEKDDKSKGAKQIQIKNSLNLKSILDELNPLM